MKFAALIVFAIIGAASASLDDDIQEIKALIPIDEIKALTVEYAANDAEFQRVVAYLRSEEFLAIIESIHNTAEWIEFVDYLADAGVHINELIVRIYELLGVSESFDAQRSFRVQQRGFHDWMNAVIALIPTDEIIALVQQKLQTSSEFQELWARLQGEDFQKVAAAVAANSEWQALLQKGRDHGAPVDAWIAMIKSLFGWSK